MSETDTLPAPEIAVPTLPENKWQQERVAFLRLLPQLLATHRDQFVAVHEGKMVDNDDDKIALALRVYARYGYVPIFIGQVTDRSPRLIRIPSPRLVRGEKTP